MSVRQSKPIITRTHLFNVGGAFMLLLGIYLGAKTSFAPKPETPLCETRYAGGVLFSLARQTGKPLAPEDLQARLAGLDRGLIANSTIVSDSAVPKGYALEIKLKRASKDDEDQSRSGIGFTWLPRQLAIATAACLSYSVWTPEDFKAGEGGVLPGFASESGTDPAAAATPERSDQQAADNGQAADQPTAQMKPFSTRPQWRADGTLAIWRTPNQGPSGLVALDPTKAALKRGGWVRIEEEVVLNTPGHPDGILRVWVDGKIAFEQYGVTFRLDELQSFQAVVGDVHHIRHGVWSGAPADTRIRLSPLELRLR